MDEKQVYVSVDNKLCGKCVGCSEMEAVVRTETLSGYAGKDKKFVFLDCDNRKTCDYLEKKFTDKK
jgi:hypothetical protein